MLTIRHVTSAGLRDVDAQAAPRVATSGDADGVVWAHFTGADDDGCALLGALGVDDLVVEDVLQTSTHPKFELHPFGGDPTTASAAGYGFLVVHGVDMAGMSERFGLETIEVDVILGQGWVVTHAAHDVGVVLAVEQTLARRPAAGASAAALAHLILDTLVDEYEPFIDDFIPDRVDEIESVLLEGRPVPDARREIALRRRDVVRLLRVAGPQAQAVRRMVGQVSAIAPGSEPLFADIADRLSYVAAQTDSLRAQLDTAFDHYQSAVAATQNEVMKVLTMVSATLLPITVVAGIYGMNFEHMPELNETWGYPAALTACVLIVVVNLLYFRWRGWIGGSGRTARVGRTLQVGAGKVLQAPALGARAVGRSAARLGGRVR